MSFLAKIGPNVTQQQSLVIPDVSLDGGPGVMTPAMLEQLLADSATSAAVFAPNAVDIYIATTGNDANDGLTPATAVATVQRAQDVGAAIYGATLVFHVGAGTFSYNTSNNAGPAALSHPKGNFAYPMYFIGELTDELGTLTSTASNGTFVDSGVVTVVNAWRGSIIEITSGVLAGEQRICISNDAAGKFFVNSPFGTSSGDPISNGDTFLVRNCASFLDGFWAQSTLFRVGFKQMGFTTFFNCFDHAQFQMSACQADIFFAFGPAHRAEFQFQAFSIPWGFGSTTPFNDANNACGMYIKNASFIGPNVHSNVQGYLVADNIFMQASNMGIFNLSQPNFLNCEILGFDQSMISLFGGETNFGTGGTVRGLIDGSMGGDQVTMYNGYLEAFSVDFENSAGSAIVVRNQSSAQVGDVGGTTAATYGIVADKMSTCIVDGLTAVTGGTADTLIGVSATAYGALPFADAFGNRINLDSSP